MSSVVDDAARPSPGHRFTLGRVPIDPLCLQEALDRIARLVQAGEGGTVFTPNVDHVVLAEENPRFDAAYSATSLSLIDGMPVSAAWVSRPEGGFRLRPHSPPLLPSLS